MVHHHRAHAGGPPLCRNHLCTCHQLADQALTLVTEAAGLRMQGKGSSSTVVM